MNPVDIARIKPGASVQAGSEDIGTVESVEPHSHAGGPTLIVRRGHAEQLVAIPVALILEFTDGQVRLNATRADIDKLLEAGHSAGVTIATPPVDEVLGAAVAELPDGPATG